LGDESIMFRKYFEYFEFLGFYDVDSSFEKYDMKKMTWKDVIIKYMT
jgi:hypothetical protein